MDTKDEPRRGDAFVLVIGGESKGVFSDMVIAPKPEYALV